MLFNPKHKKRFGSLEERLRIADAITPELMSDVIAQACTRLAAQAPSAKAQLNRLIEAGAWTDATLALVKLELPQWKLRRLVCEDGEWLCSLCKQPQLPIGLDDLVEAKHDVMPLAILIALVEARQSAVGAAPVLAARSASDFVVCCDNFA